jgi:PAS domain S-box-containing protein
MRHGRTLIALLTCVALATGAAVWWYYQRECAAIQVEALRELSGIAIREAGQVATWRNERAADGVAIAASPFVALAKNVLDRGSATAAQRDEILRFMRALSSAYSYANAVLVDLDGRSVVGVRDDWPGPEYHASLARRAVAARRPILSDLVNDPVSKRVLMAEAVPIETLGALILDIDAQDFLVPYLVSWPTSARTGEAILVRLDGDESVALSSKAGSSPTLVLRRRELRDDLVKARHNAGYSTTGVDYRGVEVLRVTAPVPNSDWFVVAKIDTAEVYAPIRSMSRAVAFVLALIVLLNAAGVGFLWRSAQLRAYRERQALAGHLDLLGRYANDVILLLDQNGQIVDANQRAEQTYGFTRAELGRMNARDLRDPAAQELFDEHWEASAGESGARFETVHRRNNGSTFPVEVSSRLIEVDGRKFRQSIIRDISERVRAEQQARALSERLIRAQEEERTRIARDLHDNLSQQIGAVSIAMSNLKREIPPEQAAILEQTGRIQKKLIHLAESTRRISHELHPAVLSTSGLASALTEYCMEFGHLTGIKVALETAGTFEDVPSPVALAVYRIAQEALQNVAKHAAVKEARVELARCNGSVSLVVSDRGVGFDTSRPSPRAGLGLVSISERTRLVNGTFEIRSRPQEGTSLRIGIPVSGAQLI